MNIRHLFFKQLNWLIIYLSILASGSYAASDIKEYQVKALFLYHFTHFITWPDVAFADRTAPFQLCLLGYDPFGEILDITVNAQKVATHPIQIKRISQLDDLTHCHIAFIHASEEAQLSAIFNLIRHQPILTVSDLEDFVKQGGMIQFIQRDHKIKMGINLQAIRSAKLKARAQLLNLSEIITP
jgi:hypothetical protein